MGNKQKPGLECDQQINLAIPFERKDHDYGWILTRVNECWSRQGIQANQGFQWMETKLDHLHEIVSDKGSTRDGAVHLEGVTPIAPAHVLQNRSFQSGRRCFPDFSTFCTHGKGSSKSKPGSVSNAHNNPSMAKPTMVSRASKNVCQNPLLLPALKDLLKDPAGKLNLLIMQNSLRLVTWTVSGRLTCRRNCKKSFKSYHKQ